MCKFSIDVNDMVIQIMTFLCKKEPQEGRTRSQLHSRAASPLHDEEEHHLNHLLLLVVQFSAVKCK